MKLGEFVTRIMYTSCGDCPIATYCAGCRAVACHTVARLYYNSHKREGEEFQWPVEICTTIRTNTITQKR